MVEPVVRYCRTPHTCSDSVVCSHMASLQGWLLVLCVPQRATILAFSFQSLQVAGMTLSPSSEMDLAVLVADGRILIYKLEAEPSNPSAPPPTLYAQEIFIPPSLKAANHGGVSDPTPNQRTPPISLDEAILPHWKMPLTDGECGRRI